MATAFRGVRVAADAHGPLDAKQRELILLAGFAATRNEGGFRVHCTRAVEAGASVAEIEQVVILLLGTSLGLAPAVEALTWAHDELDLITHSAPVRYRDSARSTKTGRT